MREIKFRGKRTDNGEWVEGYYYKAKYCRTDDELCDYITVPHPEEYNEPSSHYIINPETVGQYTGLTDKNGKKIFEGDIVKGTFLGFPISIKDYMFCICWQEDVAGYRANYFENVEVVGNIHDNPEILEGR